MISPLSIFLERKVVNVHVTNVGVDQILEAFVEFDDNTKMKLAILIDQNIIKLHRLSEYYLMRLFGSQEEYDLNPCQFRNDDGILFFPDGMLKISVYSTENLDKSYDQMNDKEKIVYYFLNCRDNGKTKMIENDEVIQTVEKRVETISNDCWTKWIEDFRIQKENELKLEFEEAHKRLKKANKRLEETNKKVQEANKRADESDKLADKMNQEMT